MENKKPVKMPIKEWLVRNVALDMQLREEVVKDIVDHQSLSAREAMLTNNSVELSGFGKFIFNKKKARQRLRKALDNKRYHEMILKGEYSDRKKKSAERKLKELLENIELIKLKLNESG